MLNKLLLFIKLWLVLSGYIYYGCYIVYEDGMFEMIILLFSWRNINNLSFVLVSDLYGMGEGRGREEVIFVWWLMSVSY